MEKSKATSSSKALRKEKLVLESRHLERRRVNNAKRKVSVGVEKELTFSIPTMYYVFLNTISHLILTTILEGRCHYLYFKNNKIEAHKLSNSPKVSYTETGGAGLNLLRAPTASSSRELKTEVHFN